MVLSEDVQEPYGRLPEVRSWRQNLPDPISELKRCSAFLITKCIEFLTGDLIEVVVQGTWKWVAQFLSGAHVRVRCDGIPFARDAATGTNRLFAGVSKDAASCSSSSLQEETRAFVSCHLQFQ